MHAGGKGSPICSGDRAPFRKCWAPHLRVIDDNPASLRGGEHFFRAPRTEHTTLSEILP
jgi:hypothetical protein